MNYLKRPFVIEDKTDGTKVVISTFRAFVKLNAVQKAMGREFQRCGEPYSLGCFMVRKQEAFELV